MKEPATITRRRRHSRLLLAVAGGAGIGTLLLLLSLAPSTESGLAPSRTGPVPGGDSAKAQQSLDRARRAFLEGDAEKAARILADSRARDPDLAADVAESLADRARVLAEAFDLSGARRALVIANSVDPLSPEVRALTDEVRAREDAAQRAADLLARAEEARGGGDLDAAAKLLAAARGLDVSPETGRRISELADAVSREAELRDRRKAVAERTRKLLDAGDVAGARRVLEQYASESGDSTFADRSEALRRIEQGGGAGVLLPARSALRWLATHRNPESGGFDRDPGAVCGHAECRSKASFPVGVSGLALMALTAYLPLDVEGEFSAPAGELARFLVGKVGPKGEVPGNNYEGAIAALALLERVQAGKTPTSAAERAAAARILERLAGQLRREDGGWRYGANDAQSDVSVTGWVLQAFHAGRAAGIVESAASVVPGAMDYLDRMTDGRGRTGYVSTGSGSEAMTAAALYVRLLLGPPADDRSLTASRRVLLAALAAGSKKSAGRKQSTTAFFTSSRDEYFLYYAANALERLGGKDASSWLPVIGKEVASRLTTKGHAAGSVDPTLRFEKRGGRVYATAIAALTLEADYRHLSRSSPLGK